MRKRKIVITAFICTIICVIICTCIFVVIKSNNKADIESQNSDYVYGASVENYDNMIDNLRTAENYNLGVIKEWRFKMVESEGLTNIQKVLVE